MSDPYVRELGRIEDIDGRRFAVGVDYDAVTIGDYRLGSEALEEFAQLFVRACREVGAQQPSEDCPPLPGDMGANLRNLSALDDVR